MRKNLIIIIMFFLATSTKVMSKDYTYAAWKKNSNTAFNKCMPIISFICTMTQDVKTNVNFGSINSHLIIFDKNNDELIRFKIKKIEYNNGRCWLTPQPIRRYTTYFVTTNCIAK